MIEKIKILIDLKYQGNASKLSKALGVNNSGFSRVIKGDVRPSVDVALKILDLHPEISAEWLMRGKGEMEPGELSEGDKAIVQSLRDQLKAKDLLIIRLGEMQDYLRKRISKLEKQLENNHS